MPTEINIFKTVKQGNLEDLKNVLEIDAKALNSQEAITQNTPIMYAALFAKKDLFYYLIGRSDCDLNILNNFGSSVLTLAILGGDPGIVQAIVENERFERAGLSLPDKTPQTPLDLAREKCAIAAQHGIEDQHSNYNVIVELLSSKAPKLRV